MYNNPKPNDDLSARVRYAHQTVPDSGILTCPDCVSEFSVAEVAPGIFEAFVRHDQDCPWLAQLGRDLT